MSSRTLRLVGIFGILWNLVGVASYLAHVGMFGPEAAAVPAGSPPTPDAITAAFAIAVFSGVVGSVGLAILKLWAQIILWISFIASVVNWVWVFAYSNAASWPLGISVIVIALALAIVAGRSRQTGS